MDVRFEKPMYPRPAALAPNFETLQAGALVGLALHRDFFHLEPDCCGHPARRSSGNARKIASPSEPASPGFIRPALLASFRDCILSNELSQNPLHVVPERVFHGTVVVGPRRPGAGTPEHCPVNPSTGIDEKHASRPLIVCALP